MWSNLHSSPTLAKLDRFLISTEWDSLFPKSFVTVLPRITSDHSPLLLKTSIEPPPRTFRFEKVWLTKEEFPSLVPIWWNELKCSGPSALGFAAKLRHCRKRIKMWCCTNFYNITSTKRALSEELHQLDILEEAQNLTMIQQEQRSRFKAQLKSVIKDEEIMWKTRSKQHWLKEWDGNSKFFHATANARKRANHIDSIQDDGRTLTRESDKSEYFYRKFKERFDPASPLSTAFGDWSDIFNDHTILAENHLTAPFSVQEIKRATFELASDKAPGPDGFGMVFYQRF